ncbi:hypothetical protein ACFZAU_20765 [Streptomyces sp. NPDC008238]
MTGRPTADDRTDPGGVEAAAVGDLARLVEAIAHSTDDSPASVLAGLSDDIVAGLFVFIRAHHMDSARGSVPHPAGVP